MNTDKQIKHSGSMSLKIKKIYMIISVFILIPATVIIITKASPQRYYIACALILIYTMLPFFISFEKSRPKSGNLVIIAVMSALAVASRVAFIWLPFFKPMSGIIFITGMALGPQAGFITGAVSALASDFIFGQGSWTPWQMFAFGIVGLIAGLLKNTVLCKKIWLRTIACGLCVLLISGPVLDTYALFTMMSDINLKSACLVYWSGFIPNAIHAGCSAATVLIFSESLKNKLNRVRIKYGLTEE